MQSLAKLLTPDGWQRTAVVMLLCFGVMVALDILFNRYYLGTAALSLTDILLNVVVVGGPFLALFFAVSLHQVRALRMLSLRSRKDGLTGLNNRQTFLDMAARRMRDQPQGMLLVLDADHFKAVNDTYGHATGDACLVAVAEHIKWSLRADDVSGRIGGEEFAILLASATIEQARVIGARMTQPIPYKGADQSNHQCVTLSVGAVALTQGVSLDRLLVCADEALYEAKAQGRARMVVWSGQDQGMTAA